jgi:hypothetical protein
MPERFPETSHFFASFEGRAVALIKARVAVCQTCLRGIQMKAGGPAGVLIGGFRSGANSARASTHAIHEYPVQRRGFLELKQCCAWGMRALLKKVLTGGVDRSHWGRRCHSSHRADNRQARFVGRSTKGEAHHEKDYVGRRCGPEPFSRTRVCAPAQFRAADFAGFRADGIRAAWVDRDDWPRRPDANDDVARRCRAGTADEQRQRDGDIDWAEWHNVSPDPTIDEIQSMIAQSVTRALDEPWSWVGAAVCADQAPTSPTSPWR